MTKPPPPPHVDPRNPIKAQQAGMGKTKPIPSIGATSPLAAEQRELLGKTKKPVPLVGKKELLNIDKITGVKNRAN